MGDFLTTLSQQLHHEIFKQLYILTVFQFESTYPLLPYYIGINQSATHTNLKTACKQWPGKSVGIFG